MDKKDIKILELEKQIVELQKKLSSARRELLKFKVRQKQQFRQDLDYLPYEDDDRTRM